MVGVKVTDTLHSIHKAFIRFTKRAEKNTDEILHSTFVDSAPLFDILSTKNNQVMYGRRGTGKTHALKYLAQHIQEYLSFPIYIDLRSVGSDGALYHDVSMTVAERSVRPILDVLNAVADELYSIAVTKISDAPRPGQISLRVDDLMAAVRDVKIMGDHKVEERSVQQAASGSGGRVGVSLSKDGPKLTGEAVVSDNVNFSRETSLQTTGQQRFHIEFGRVQGSHRSLLGVIENPEIWVLIYEWSEIPLELQPYLADLLRRSLLPIDNFIIRIAAIEHRSNISIGMKGGGYIGLELGANLSIDLNLDDFLVFDNDQVKAIDFLETSYFIIIKLLPKICPFQRAMS